MSDSMIDMKILRKCEGELEHVINCRCVEPCSTEDYINAMEEIITRTRIGKAWTRVPMESKMVSKASRDDKRPERPVLKCHKCGSTSHLANTCTKKANINEVQCTEEKEESDLDSAVSEETPKTSLSSHPQAREALEKHIQELIQLGVLSQLGHNEEVEVTTPVSIALHNDKSRMVGDLGALNTYTVPDRYSIHRIQETLTQLSKAKYITSLNGLTGFHQNVLTPRN
ncbi:hypothetical protein O181_003696 [Austropuccinia psidii MF-1]|uniref:CCHC-type domain-containing protein n=1 Tax=Austropuccinia psidii MF-1 TaxID=1389203 RepID=A0A9Q3BE58_9BASI|nr:hypothetical protein [Austropuccinia psidii MF-1]